MHLHAALVPPPSIAEAVAALVESIQPDPAPVVEEPRGLFRRRGRAVQPAGEPEEVEPAPPLDLVPSDQLQLPLTMFGNVTSDQLPGLQRTVAEVASGLPPATVWAAGGAALEFTGDRSVWLKLDGDVDGLWAVFRALNEAVERLGFFLDRRKFRPWLAVATINDETTAPHLERVVAALDAYQGEPWLVDGISLMKRILDSRPPRSTTLDRVPLGG
jgi:2'-5' RNA ligase